MGRLLRLDWDSLSRARLLLAGTLVCISTQSAHLELLDILLNGFPISAFSAVL